MTDQEKVRNLMAQCQYAVIAVTLKDGSPWAVPLKMQKMWERFC